MTDIYMYNVISARARTHTHIMFGFGCCVAHACVLSCLRAPAFGLHAPGDTEAGCVDSACPKVRLTPVIDLCFESFCNRSAAGVKLSRSTLSPQHVLLAQVGDGITDPSM